MKSICFLLCCVSFAIGLFVARYTFIEKSHSLNDTTIVLEKIKEVFKLVFVEASFNELYSHKQYNWFDISPLRKSAIIRIQATVTAGVNMDSAKIIIEEKDKIIHLSFDHQASILHIDHSLDYYDLQQGSFNSFSSKELTDLQTKAKELIREKASQSELIQKAGDKRDIMISTLKQLIESIGWTLYIEDTGKQNSILQ